MNIHKEKSIQYDAIVVGSGISGGWAAKELCEAGLKTLVLERGRMVKHLEDYPTMHNDPWDLPHNGRTPNEIAEKHYSKQSGGVLMKIIDILQQRSEHDYDEVNHSMDRGNKWEGDL